MAYSEANGLRIIEAPKGHATANAGLEVDDRILAIDGEPTEELTMGQIVERLRGIPETTVTVEYVRDGERHRARILREPYRQRRR